MMDGSNENANDIPLNSLQDICLPSQRMAVATMSQQFRQLHIATPEQLQPQIMYQHPIPYPSYGPNAADNPIQGAYAVNPVTLMMSSNSQGPASNQLPATASNVASPPGIGISNGREMAAPANGSINIYPFMNMGDSIGSLHGMLPNMPCIQNFTSFPVKTCLDTIVPKFNNLEPITITRAILTPPRPGKRQSRGQKPPGCRTVFVANFPEKITDDIIKEAFQICGPISAVRMSKKNFCHVRFVNMESVDQALLLSGFRIRIEENEDPAYNGILHVDYTAARDDQHDYESLERARRREELHRLKQTWSTLTT